ncbi:hypothetical protein WJX82_010815 [Trebouxia sp. C0006]
MGFRSAFASGCKKVTGVVFARPSNARIASKVDPCTHRNSNLQTAFTPKRPLSIANALDDSSYEEAPTVARYAAGVLLDDHVENGPLIQSTLVCDGSPNNCQSLDFLCLPDGS